MDEREEDSVDTALRRLVAEISVGDYRDPLGHALTLNTAYLKAVATLELNDLLERDP